MVKYKLRILVDPNLPPSLGDWLGSTFRFKVITLKGEIAPRIPDPEIAKIANGNDAIILTLDEDFADLSKYPICELPGVIFLQLGRRTLAHIKGVLTSFLRSGHRKECAHSLVTLRGERECLVTTDKGTYRLRY